MNKSIVFVSGLLASGKTVFSEYLSEQLGVLVVNKDYLKEILCDTVGFTDRDENLKLSGATHHIMRHIAENCMKIGLPIILESNFNPGDAVYFKGEIEKYRYKAVTVTLTGDKKVLYERFMKRWENRHPGHKSFDPNWEDFNNQQEGWQRFDVGGEKLTVDTTFFEEVNYEEIIAKIKRYCAQT